MREKNREIIERYIEAYNNFDIANMVALLHLNVVFRNVSNGETNAETRGIQQFKELAEQSTTMFSSRRQMITDYKESTDKIVVHIDYEGKLAVDMPNGLKAGDTIRLNGTSIFEIEDGKIAVIEDRS